MHYLPLFGCLLLTPFVVRAQTVLLDVPLSIDIAGKPQPMMSYYDGSAFWVDASVLGTTMGFEVMEGDSTSMTMRDAQRAITFHEADRTVILNNEVILTEAGFLRGPEGQILVSMEAIQNAFGADVEWDEFALTLRFSTRATTFTPSTPKKDLAPPAPLRFPRERSWWGGFHLFYDLNHRWSTRQGSEFTGSAVATTALAGGAVRVQMSRSNPSAVYQLPFDKAWLTHASVIWHANDQIPSAVLSNRPLVPRRRYSTRQLTGTTFPHAVVESTLGGETIERIQADRAGRYAVEVPVYYGTNRASVSITPLGTDALEPLLHYELTPQSALPAKEFEYELRLPRHLSGHLAYGFTDRFTVRARGTHGPMNLHAGSTIRIFRSMYAELDLDVLHLDGTAYLQHWRDRGQWGVRYQRAADRHTLRGQGVAQFGPLQAGSSWTYQTFGGASTLRMDPHLGYRAPIGLDVQLRSRMVLTPVASWSLFPTFALGRRVRGVLVRLGAGIEVDPQAIHRYTSSLQVSRRRWHLSVAGSRSSTPSSTNLTATFYVNTDWAWLGTHSTLSDERRTLTQTARGTVGIGRRITLSSIHRENAQAVIHFFVDTNRNGVRDEGEQVLHSPSVRVGSFPISRRFSGDLVVSDLSPNERYTVDIFPESIEDPLLYPATGYRFAFIAQAGRTREIAIALQPMALVVGTLQGWTGAYELLQIRIQNDQTVQDLAVYHDGGFFTQIPPGTYELIVSNSLTKEKIWEEPLQIESPADPVTILIPSGDSPPSNKP